MKVALAKVFLGNYNMLLLDEPTNYLDLATQEELESMLQEYPGTILLLAMTVPLFALWQTIFYK